MRLGFLLALLLASCFYTYYAFAELAFLSVTGRLGPGFFPRLIGVGLIVFCLASLLPDIARSRADRTDSPHWGIVATIALLSGGFVLLLNLLGGVLSMAVFLLVTLSILNRGNHLQNVAIAIALPLGIYYLFDVWLNAAMPEGVVPLPI